MLPRIEKIVRSAVQAKSNQDQAEHGLQMLIQRIMLMGGITVDQIAVEAMKSMQQASVERLKTALDEIAEAGCLIKDLETGLLDFPTLFLGEEVYLCWRMDEADITHWHGVHEGFDHRRAIDKHFLENHSD